MSSLVSLVKTPISEEELRLSVSKALDIAGFKPNAGAESVAIKVNLCYYWDASTGHTTDPRIVAAIIDYVRDKCGKNIDIKVVEADATAMRTEYSFKMLGYEKLAKKKDIELFNLSTDDIEETTVVVNKREIKFKVPRLLLESDFFINVPKLKIARETVISCAMKNIFGCIALPRKVIYHPFLNEAIVGINKILHPHVTIVDGLVALGRVPIKLGLVMAGSNPFSIDYVASNIMGYNPMRIGCLRLGSKENLGDPRRISVIGEDVRSLRKMFPHRNNFVFSKWWNTQLRLLKWYSKIVGDIIPPIIGEG